jgi:hypothetical protein
MKEVIAAISAPASIRMPCLSHKAVLREVANRATQERIGGVCINRSRLTRGAIGTVYSRTMSFDPIVSAPSLQHPSIRAFAVVHFAWGRDHILWRGANNRCVLGTAIRGSRKRDRKRSTRWPDRSSGNCRPCIPQVDCCRRDQTQSSSGGTYPQDAKLSKRDRSVFPYSYEPPHPSLVIARQ